MGSKWQSGNAKSEICDEFKKLRESDYWHCLPAKTKSDILALLAMYAEDTEKDGRENVSHNFEQLLAR